MLSDRVVLSACVYTASAVAQTIAAFAHLCEADFRDEVLTISAQDKHVVQEFLNYALCLSAQEQL